MFKNPYRGIILVALFLRLLWAIAVPVIPLSDGNAYDTFAQNLANGNGYGWGINDLTAYWPPGTSFIYAIFYKIFGHTYWPIILFNLLLAAATIWVSMYLAEKWFSRRIAILTGLILAFWPAQIQFTTVLSSELLFTALVMVALWVWLEEKLTLRSIEGYWSWSYHGGCLLCQTNWFVNSFPAIIFSCNQNPGDI